MTGVPAELGELADEFPGYEFGTQQTWEGVSLVAVRQDGSARPGLYVVITPDPDEMRHALLEGERPWALRRGRDASPVMCAPCGHAGSATIVAETYYPGAMAAMTFS